MPQIVYWDTCCMTYQNNETQASISNINLLPLLSQTFLVAMQICCYGYIPWQSLWGGSWTDHWYSCQKLLLLPESGLPEQTPHPSQHWSASPVKQCDQHNDSHSILPVCIFVLAQESNQPELQGYLSLGTQLQTWQLQPAARWLTQHSVRRQQAAPVKMRPLQTSHDISAIWIR